MTPDGPRRAPHGARGLKYKVHSDRFSAQRQSRPARGAWIEILGGGLATEETLCRAPHGARGLKYPCREGAGGREGRAPRGAHGLK